MFTRAVIYSESKHYKQKKITRSDLPIIINSLNESSDRSDIFENEELSDEEKFHTLISSLQSAQIWYQRHLASEKTGLLYALYSELPTRHRRDLQSKHKNNYVDIPDVIANDIGIDIELYFLISLFLINVHYKQVYETYIQPDESFKNKIKKLHGNERKQTQLKSKYLGEFDNKYFELYEVLGFSKEWLKQNLDFIESEKIDNFLKLTSRRFKEIRQLNELDPFQSGHISQRLTPLERYPIVKADFPVYFISNFRFANLGFTELLRFALQDLFDNNAFNEMLGSSQELLIGELTDQMADSKKIVEERTYTKNKTEYRGPDFIILDKGRLIIIESKSKHIKLDSRLNHYSSHLLDDLSSTIDALLEAQKNKIPDIINNTEVYGDINQNLANFDQHPPLLVGLIGEGVVTMQEHITKLKEKNPNHKINTLQFPHVFIDLFHFYKAIEICKTNDHSLYNLLKEYWEVGNNLSAKSDSADMFGSREYDLEKSYSQKQFQNLVQKGRKHFQ